MACYRCNGEPRVARERTLMSWPRRRSDTGLPTTKLPSRRATGVYRTLAMRRLISRDVTSRRRAAGNAHCQTTVCQWRAWSGFCRVNSITRVALRVPLLRDLLASYHGKRELCVVIRRQMLLYWARSGSPRAGLSMDGLLAGRDGGKTLVRQCAGQSPERTSSMDRAADR